MACASTARRMSAPFASPDVYAATRGAAADLAAVVRGLLLRLPGATVGGAVVGRVRTEAAPVSRPYENLGLRRVGGTYSLYLHPVS